MYESFDDIQTEAHSKKRISAEYCGEELRFRKFLSTYTRIGLEIMEADLLNAQCLFATFRLQIMLARKPYKPHFIKTFEAQSPFYNSMPSNNKKQFWSDLENWPNPPQVDWAHLFVNMVLGCDWPIKLFLYPQPPLPISDINYVINQLGMNFHIPEDWNP